MLLFASLCTVVAIATAQAPKPCCSPDKQDFYVTDVRSLTSGDSVTALYSIDSTSRKEAQVYFKNVPGQPQQVLYRVVQDFSAQKMYTIQSDNTCKTNPLNNPTFAGFQLCIPPDALFVGSAYFGRASTPETTFNVWQFPAGSINVTLAVDKDCTIIAEVIRGQYAGFAVDTTLFMNGFKAGNSYPASFDVPSTCSQ